MFHELIPPFPDFNSLLGSLPEVIMNKCIETGVKPHRLKYRNPDLSTACNFLKHKTGIYIWHSYKLEEFDNAFESLVHYLDHPQKES